MTEPETSTLDVPGAVLHYDVRRADSAEPPLLMVGSPMDAAGFATLAGHFPDRTVVTYDPRGAGRSTRAEGGQSTPDQHADDLHRIIEVVGGPVDVFASSGGAVNALALVAKHPQDVRTLVAHEPPAVATLPDRQEAATAVRDMHQTYQASGFGAAMAMFIALTGLRGPVPADFSRQPMPDPAAFGMPAGDDGSRDDVLFGQNLLTCTLYEHDFVALRAAPTRIVPAVGAESEGTLAARAGQAVAEALGVEAAVFPSHHGGFMSGEYGMTGEPEAFAAKLREVLAEKV